MDLRALHARVPQRMRGFGMPARRSPTTDSLPSATDTEKIRQSTDCAQSNRLWYTCRATFTSSAGSLTRYSHMRQHRRWPCEPDGCSALSTTRLAETRRMDLRHRPTLLVARLRVAGDPAETGPCGIASTLRHVRHRTDGLANARGLIGRVLVHSVRVAELGFSTRHGRQLISAHRHLASLGPDPSVAPAAMTAARRAPHAHP